MFYAGWLYEYADVKVSWEGDDPVEESALYGSGIAVCVDGFTVVVSCDDVVWFVGYVAWSDEVVCEVFCVVDDVSCAFFVEVVECAAEELSDLFCVDPLCFEVYCFELLEDDFYLDA